MRVSGRPDPEDTEVRLPTLSHVTPPTQLGLLKLASEASREITAPEAPGQGSFRAHKSFALQEEAKDTASDCAKVVPCWLHCWHCHPSRAHFRQGAGLQCLSLTSLQALVGDSSSLVGSRHGIHPSGLLPAGLSQS